jgi:adenylosuccinate lyase
VWKEGADFLEALLADKDVTKVLAAEQIRAQFDLDYHVKHVDTIFNRVFGKT